MCSKQILNDENNSKMINETSLCKVKKQLIEDKENQIKIIDKMSNLKNSIYYLFEVNEIQSFLKSDLDNELISEQFQCNGINYRIFIRKSTINDNDNEINVLNIGLICDYYSNLNWKIKGSVKMTLYTHTYESNKNKQTDPLSNDFQFKNDLNTKCYRAFINLDQLYKFKNGFIKNDKIIIGIDLQTEKLEKDERRKSLFKWMKM